MGLSDLLNMRRVRQSAADRGTMTVPAAEDTSSVAYGDTFPSRGGSETQLLQKDAPAPAVDDKVLAHAYEIFNKYKEGKVRLEEKLKRNERFWRLRNWDVIDPERKEWKPATAWLHSCIKSKHADVMDSYPTCNFRARQSDDVQEAKKLSAVMPVIMAQADMEKTYSDTARYLLMRGGACFGTFWDQTRHNGLGDIVYNRIDLLNLYWEPGIEDIQDSANVFLVELVDNRVLEDAYPQTKGRLGGKNVTVGQYHHDDRIDTSQKSVVIDWYYHKTVDGVRTLQYCKFVNKIVLYATENETEQPMRQEVDPVSGQPILIRERSVAQRGLYDHGQYPFVVFSLYPVEGSLCGYGLTDIGRDTQISLDILNKSILKNAQISASPRFLYKVSAGVDPNDFADLEKELIPAQNVSEDAIRPIVGTSLSGLYEGIYTNKVEELKYITSNQDVNNGAAPSGVTAASALAALQEVAGKDSRNINKIMYRAYRKVVYQALELVRQFYTAPREFRMIPDQSGERFMTYDNSMLQPQQMMLGEVPNGFRVPEFDVEVSTEKESPYKKLEQNELALQFYNQGFFNPQMADQALACLKMMDFSHKEDVMAQIDQNATLLGRLQSVQQLALRLAMQIDPKLAQQMAMQFGMDSRQVMPAGDAVMPQNTSEEHPNVEKARAQAGRVTEV